MTKPVGPVLIVPSEYPHAGHPLAGVFIRDQAWALCRAGIPVDVAFMEPRSLRSFEVRHLRESHFQRVASLEDGVFTLREKGWNPLLTTVPGAMLYAWRIRSLLNAYVAMRGMPALIHAHNALWAGYAAADIARLYRLPLVITEHDSGFAQGSLRRWKERYVSKAYGSAAEVITVSRALGDALRIHLGGRGTTVVPNVVDTGFFHLPEEGRCTGRFSFLAIGALIPRKGLDVLITAFAMRFRGKGEVRLLIGGGGAEELTLRALTGELGVQGQVKFLGELARPAVRKAMWEADALVLSSRHETFGVVLIEALATGLPVIATVCGGPEEFVVPEVGILVPPNHPEALADALEEIQARRCFDAERLRAYAVGRFSEAVVSAELARVYEQVLRSVNAAESGELVPGEGKLSR